MKQSIRETHRIYIHSGAIPLYLDAITSVDSGHDQAITVLPAKTENVHNIKLST